MKKKGVVPFAVIIVVAIVALVIASLIIFGALFSTTFRLTAIGVAIIIIALVIGIPAITRTGKVTRSSLGLVLIPIIIGVVLVLLPVFGVFGQSFFDPPTLCSGQVLSIDPNINVVFSNELNKNVFRVSYSTLPSGECLKLRVDESLFEAEFPNFDAESDVFLDISLVDQAKVFNIQSVGPSLKKFGIIDIGNEAICTHSGAIDRCSSQGAPNSFASLFESIPGSDCNCMKDIVQGAAGDFLLTEGIEWRTQVKVGSTPISTLSHNVLSDNIGNIGFIRWAGNLGSNVDFGGLVGQKDTFLPAGDNVWRMVGNNIQNLNFQYNDLRGDVASCDVGALASFNDCPGSKEEMLGYNSFFIQQTADQTIQWSFDEPAVRDGEAQIIGNQLIAFLESPIVYPTFILDLDVDAIGVFTTVGEPKAICPVGAIELISGETVIAPLQIQNLNNDFGGTFGYELNCNQGSQLLSPAPPITIGPGQSSSISAVLGLTVPQEGSRTAECEFVVVEQNTGASDSCLFDYTSTNLGVLCVDGIQVCEAGNTELWTCANGVFTMMQCTCGVIDGISQCVEEGGVGNGQLSADRLACEQRAQDQPFLGWTFRVTIEEPSLFQKIITFGLAQDTVTGQCIPSFLMFYVIGGVILLLVVVGLILFLPKRKRKRNK